MDFGLFYFSSLDTGSSKSKYSLLFDSVDYADRNGFNSVWVPERHFHPVGGLFPNPAVLASALAVKTKHLEIRAGSVVLPLHDTLRVAEEWSMVDNLSNGRTSVSIASGWNANDFVFCPDDYDGRHNKMYQQITLLQRLWRGERVSLINGLGKQIDVKIFPEPITPELPIWITAGGGVNTFIKAGELNLNILTHLLGQDIDQLADKIDAYREARRNAGHIGDGKVALMLHTFIGTNLFTVKNEARAPLKKYLGSHMDLKNLGHTKGINIKEIEEKIIDEMLELAFERYWNTAALIGTVQTSRKMVLTLHDIGVTEIACLVDFGISQGKVMEGLEHLRDLKNECRIL